MLGFEARQRFREGIRHHVVGGTIHDLDLAVLHYIANVVVLDVDVFRSSMVGSVLGECNR